MSCKRLVGVALLLSATWGLSGCIAVGAAGAAAGVAGAAVGAAAKGTGMAIGAVIPDGDDRKR